MYIKTNENNKCKISNTTQMEKQMKRQYETIMKARTISISLILLVAVDYCKRILHTQPPDIGSAILLLLLIQAL